MDYVNTMPKYDFNDSSIRYDRVLLVDEQKFYVQSGMLATWFDFFNGLFNSEFKEAKEEEIELKEVGADEFKNFLLYIYPGKFKISADICPSMIHLAHRFMAPVVLSGCRDFIEGAFGDLDKLDILELAIKYNMEI